MLLAKAEKKKLGVGNQKKEDPCYIGAESLVTLSSAIMWKAENAPNEVDNLLKEISKQNTGGAKWYLLAA